MDVWMGSKLRVSLSSNTTTLFLGQPWTCNADRCDLGSNRSNKDKDRTMNSSMVSLIDGLMDQSMQKPMAWNRRQLDQSSKGCRLIFLSRFLSYVLFIERTIRSIE